MSFLGHDCDEERISGKFGTDLKGRMKEKQRKEKGALDVKFEGMAGGSRCERAGGRIAGESFKQGIVTGHDRPSQQIRHIYRELFLICFILSPTASKLDSMTKLWNWWRKPSS